MLAQMSRTIAEFFVFVDFDTYSTEPDRHNGGLFLRKQLEGGGYSRG